jgi:hypothetical protein
MDFPERFRLSKLRSISFGKQLLAELPLAPAIDVYKSAKMMKQPVNDMMAEKIYVRIVMKFFTVVGLAGGCMSIAGPVDGLTINPNQLTATNFKQVERFGLSADLYFDCGKNNKMASRFTELRKVNCVTALCMSFSRVPWGWRGRYGG